MPLSITPSSFCCSGLFYVFWPGRSDDAYSTGRGGARAGSVPLPSDDATVAEAVEAVRWWESRCRSRAMLCCEW